MNKRVTSHKMYNLKLAARSSTAVLSSLFPQQDVNMKLIKMALLTVSLAMPSYVFAAGYAVIDLTRVVDNSSYLKQQNQILNNSIKPLTAKMEQIGKDIEALRKQAEAQGSKLTQADAQKMNSQYQAKVAEFDSSQKELQSKVQSGLQSMNNTLQARINQSAEQLRQENNLDFILNKNAVVAFDSKNDLTDKLIQKVNAAK